MDEYSMIVGIVLIIGVTSCVKAYFNSKNKHYIVGEIERLQQRIEVLERQIGR